MKFPGAPYGLKMACGENPKRVYGAKGRAPSTRMGNVAGYRAAWINAADYAPQLGRLPRQGRARREGRSAQARPRSSTPWPACCSGEILVENHCYRADEMAQMIDISKEFGYHITAFHHAVEAYKIADMLAANDICVATWANWWGVKMECFDGIEANAAADPRGRRLRDHQVRRPGPHPAAEPGGRRGAGRRPRGRACRSARPTRSAGSPPTPPRRSASPSRPARWSPASAPTWCIWDRDPFSIYARAQRVYIDGGVAYDSPTRACQPKSDFELGQGVRPMIRSLVPTFAKAAAALAAAAVASQAHGQTVALVNAHILTAGPKGEIAERDGPRSVTARSPRSAPTSARQPAPR